MPLLRFKSSRIEEVHYAASSVASLGVAREEAGTGVYGCGLPG
jgi:hypothetical protein